VFCIFSHSKLFSFVFQQTGICFPDPLALVLVCSAVCVSWSLCVQVTRDERHPLKAERERERDALLIFLQCFLLL